MIDILNNNNDSNDKQWLFCQFDDKNLIVFIHTTINEELKDSYEMLYSLICESLFKYFYYYLKASNNISTIIKLFANISTDHLIQFIENNISSNNNIVISGIGGTIIMVINS